MSTEQSYLSKLLIAPIGIIVGLAIGWIGIHALCPQSVVLWLASIIGTGT